MPQSEVLNYAFHTAQPSTLTSYYEDAVERLGAQIEALDTSVKVNFTHAMWLIMALGGNQTAFAERHGYQPTTVSRWVNGSKAPPVLRRSPIVRDAFEHLRQSMRAGTPVPMRSFGEEDAPLAAPKSERRAGRPAHR